MVFSKEYLIFNKIKNKYTMILIGNHYGDVANWVEKVIDSCETTQQAYVARNLVRLFKQRIFKEAPELYAYYTLHFNNCLNHKLYSNL